MENTEKWLPVPGFGGAYEVSSEGNVRSWRVKHRPDLRRAEPHTLVPKICRKGRKHVLFYYPDGTRIQCSVHRAVLWAFVGPAPEGKEACHNNGDHTDNRIENLRWGTRRENYADAMRHGTAVHAKPGEAHHGAKLWDEAVRVIRAEPKKKGTIQMLAKAFGVSSTTIADVRTGRYWAHLP